MRHAADQRRRRRGRDLGQRPALPGRLRGARGAAARAPRGAHGGGAASRSRSRRPSASRVPHPDRPGDADPRQPRRFPWPSSRRAPRSSTIRSTWPGRSVAVTATSLGNPHCAVFLRYARRRRAPASLGPALERHPFFPRRTNVEFVTVSRARELRVRFWERGVGYTRASGTGSASAAVAAMLTGRADRQRARRLRRRHPRGGVARGRHCPPDRRGRDPVRRRVARRLSRPFRASRSSTRRRDRLRPPRSPGEQAEVLEHEIDAGSSPRLR